MPILEDSCEKRQKAIIKAWSLCVLVAVLFLYNGYADSAKVIYIDKILTQENSKIVGWTIVGVVIVGLSGVLLVT